VRWSLRLVAGGAADSLFVHCLLRDDDGRWLAGRRAPWLAVLPGAWHLGAAGSVGAHEDPVATIRQELDEEWGLAAERLTLAALLADGSGQTVLLAVAGLTGRPEPRPNREHDAWAWWPADPGAWPDAAAPDLRQAVRLARGAWRS
jgi:8-oxo-dGTP diphosphatase